MVKAYKNYLRALLVTGMIAAVLMPTQAQAVSATVTIDENTLGQAVLNGLGSVARSTISATASTLGTVWTENVANKDKTLIVGCVALGAFGLWGVQKASSLSKKLYKAAKKAVDPLIPFAAAGAVLFAQYRYKKDAAIRPALIAAGALVTMSYWLSASDQDLKEARAESQAAISKEHDARDAAEDAALQLQKIADRRRAELLKDVQEFDGVLPTVS